jgi:hypothetical protein
MTVAFIRTGSAVARPEHAAAREIASDEVLIRRIAGQEQQADHDAQDTQHAWGPRCEKAVDRRHHNFSHERPEALPNPPA